MSDQDFSDQSDEVYVAPLDDFADELDLGELPGWPKVVGIVSIIFGSLSFTCAGLGLATPLIFGGMMQGAQNQMKGGFPPIITNPNPLIYIAGAISIAWAVLLLVSGIITILRKPAGRTLHLVWCIGAIVLFVWGISIQLHAQKEIADWVTAHPSSDYAKMTQGASSHIGLIVGLVVGSIWGLAWPTFCLIWFGVVKTKPDAMTGGVEEQAA